MPGEGVGAIGCRIGADAHSGVVHTVEVTAANVSDVVMTGELLHGNEDDVYADAGYIGAEKRDELKDLDVTWNTAEKRSKVTAMEDGPLKGLSKRAEQIKARIRARVEHPFHVVKDLFGHRKLRYRGLKKNRVQLQVMFALANLVITKKTLLA
jgi:IS5 family transposase